VAAPQDLSTTRDPDSGVRTIASDDRGLLYGDGVFRTFRHGPQGVWDREAQFDLLANDCERLGLPRVPSARLDARIAEAVAAAGTWPLVVRVTVTRGCGGRGYRPPSAAVPAVHVSVSRAPERRAWDSGYRLRLCGLRLGHQPRLAGCKHLNRLENVLARAEWEDPEIDDGVLLDQAGWVVETVSANLFWRCGEQVFTSALDLAGVAGRQRARVLELLEASGIAVRIGQFPLQSLATAEEAWVCNSVIGLRAVTAFEHRLLSPGPVANALANGPFIDWQPGAT
jgi:4-amino-4-deoxychorismate lyase